MLTHKIVTFRLPEKPFRAFLDDFDPKLNDPPMHRYPAQFQLVALINIVLYLQISSVLRTLQEWCDLHPFVQKRHLQVQMCCRLQRQNVRKR